METKKKPTKKATKKAKLTALEAKRVAILKDALAQIKAEAYDVKSNNGYVRNDNLHYNIERLCDMADIVAPKGEKTELQYFMNKLVNKEKPCEVCAKGAIFLSSIRKFNNLSLKEISGGGDILDSIASDKVRQLFGRENADLMEEYFESGNPDHEDWDLDGNDLPEDPWIKISDTDRLIRILKNAIRNKGIFKPEQEKF